MSVLLAEFERSIDAYSLNINNMTYIDSISTGTNGFCRWLHRHLYDCQYFNGFSVIFDNNSNNSNGNDFIVRCSCGEWYLLDHRLKTMRFLGRGMAEFIAALNYEAKDRLGYSIKKQVDTFIDLEFERRLRLHQEHLQIKRKDVEKKYTKNSIMQLDI